MQKPSAHLLAQLPQPCTVSIGTLKYGNTLPPLKGWTWVPMGRNYDIFKKHPDGIFIWVETTRDLEAAKKRVKQLAAWSPGEYKVFCQNTRRVVASESGMKPTQLQYEVT